MSEGNVDDRGQGPPPKKRSTIALHSQFSRTHVIAHLRPIGQPLAFPLPLPRFCLALSWQGLVNLPLYPFASPTASRSGAR